LSNGIRIKKILDDNWDVAGGGVVGAVNARVPRLRITIDSRATMWAQQ